jgi:hypothetical protein
MATLLDRHRLELLGLDHSFDLRRTRLPDVNNIHPRGEIAGTEAEAAPFDEGLRLAAPPRDRRKRPPGCGRCAKAVSRCLGRGPPRRFAVESTAWPRHIIGVAVQTTTTSAGHGLRRGSEHE